MASGRGRRYAQALVLAQQLYFSVLRRIVFGQNMSPFRDRCIPIAGNIMIKQVFSLPDYGTAWFLSCLLPIIFKLN